MQTTDLPISAPDTFIWTEMVEACERAVGHHVRSSDDKVVRVGNPYQAALAWWGSDKANWLASQLWIHSTKNDRCFAFGQPPGAD